MGDSPAGGAAFLRGGEIVNDARTLAYLDAGYGPRSLQVNGGCACPRIRELIECGSEPYLSPTLDPAPWYDSSVPESADFAGFLTVEFEGLGSTYTRSITEKITGGAVLGRLRPQPRTLRWNGYLFGRSDCAVRYGLSWMAANLKGTNCACSGEDLDLLVCCPDLISEIIPSPPVPGCDPASPVLPEACPPFTQPDAFRQLKNVGLLAGPTILSQRRVGCTSSCGNSSCTGDDTVIMEVEFSLLAGNPYLYGCEVCICVDQRFPISELVEECDASNGYIAAGVTKVPRNGRTDAQLKAAVAALEDCGSESCDPVVDCTRVDLGWEGCKPVVLPTIEPFEDPCFCEPLDPVQICCSVPADSFGQFFEGAPVIDIFSGSKSMRATTVRFFVNPRREECCDVASDPCFNCDSIQIKYIPANSTMTIDGTTRTVTVLCQGQSEPILADHLTVTPFNWPILQCADYCICVETEGGQVAPNATVSVSVTPREM